MVIIYCARSSIWTIYQERYWPVGKGRLQPRQDALGFAMDPHIERQAR